MMLGTLGVQRCLLFISTTIPSQLRFSRARTARISTILAKKLPTTDEEPSTSTDKSMASFLSRGISKPLVARAAIAVLGLGFVDAGYSGDWSRIGVISKHTEELFRFSAFFVVPLCLLLIYFIPGPGEKRKQ